jgi:hypothetical protein
MCYWVYVINYFDQLVSFCLCVPMIMTYKQINTFFNNYN